MKIYSLLREKLQCEVIIYTIHMEKVCYRCCQYQKFSRHLHFQRLQSKLAWRCKQLASGNPASLVSEPAETLMSHLSTSVMLTHTGNSPYDTIPCDISYCQKLHWVLKLFSQEASHKGFLSNY